MFSYMDLHEPDACLVPARPEESFSFSETEITEDCKQLCEF